MEETVETRVIRILNKVIEGADITEKQSKKDLMKLGMDSYIFVNLIVCIEEEFKVEIPDGDLLMTKMNTVRKIVRVLEPLVQHEE